MIEDVQWILDALAADKTKTRSGLAKALGLNKSQITRLLQGRRRLKASEIEPTENYLGVSAPWRASRGFGDEGASFTGPDIADKTSIIFGASVDIGGKWIVHRTKTPVNRLARPPSVENA
ncbi:MAG: helix-turn-helix transcriptional regulator, partial [Pseudomonadota bacterium]